MRQIKFRGKRIKDNKWVYGYLSAKCQITTCLNSEEGNAVHLVNSETIGQFTGLQDKNGKDIYEGDKFKVVWKSKENTYQEGIVCWNLQNSKWDSKTATFPSRSRRTTTITGNIYDK